MRAAKNLKTVRPRVAVYGHFGGWNAGDEAILVSMIDGLRRAIPEIDITVISGSFNEQGTGLCREFGAEPCRLKSFRALRTVVSRPLLVGGGQMLTGDVGSKGLIACLALVTVNRLSLRSPELVFIGVQGITNRRSKLLARLIGVGAKKIGTRDENSAGQLLRAGVAETKVRLVPDVVLGRGLLSSVPLTRSDQSRARVLIVGHRSPRRTLIALYELTSVIDTITTALPGHDVVVASHDCRVDYDNGLIDDLERTLGDEANVRFLKYSNWNSLMAVYADIDVVVSSRMHPLMLGAVYGAGVIPLTGSQKVEAFADRIGCTTIVPGDMPSLEVALAHPARLSGDALTELEQAVRDEFDGLADRRGWST